MRPSAFAIDTLPLSKVSNLLVKMPKEVVSQRIVLLVDFNRQASSMLDNTYWAEEVRENSIQMMLMKCKSMLLPSLKIKFLTEYVKSRATNDQNHLKPRFDIQYPQVEAYRKSATKHDPRFIQDSCFAWYMLAAQAKDSEFTGLASKERNFDYYVRPNDKGYDWLFEEMTREF